MQTLGEYSISSTSKGTITIVSRSQLPLVLVLAFCILNWICQSSLALRIAEHCGIGWVNIDWAIQNVYFFHN